MLWNLIPIIAFLQAAGSDQNDNNQQIRIATPAIKTDEIKANPEKERKKPTKLRQVTQRQEQEDNKKDRNPNVELMDRTNVVSVARNLFNKDRVQERDTVEEVVKDKAPTKTPVKQKPVQTKPKPTSETKSETQSESSPVPRKQKKDSKKNSKDDTKTVKTTKKNKDALSSSPVTNIKRLTFKKDESVTVDFEHEAIISNVTLYNVLENDKATPIEILNNSIKSPKEYMEHVDRLENADRTTNDNYEDLYKKACTKKLVILLNPDRFEEAGRYSLSFNLWNRDRDEIFTEEFVFRDNKFVHAIVPDDGNWYSSVWFWIGMGAILIALIAIGKAVCF